MPVNVPANAKRVFRGELFDIWQWEQKLYDGSHATYECETRQDTVSVIGFLDQKTVILTRQEQPGRSRAFLDVPGGRVDPGETHEAAARREFLEETGLKIGKIQPFSYTEHTGGVRFAQTVFIAAQLTDHIKERQLDPGEKIDILPTSWQEMVRLSLKHELRQSEVMLASLTLEYDPGSKLKLKTFLATL